MTFRRGFFRLWVLGSVLFVIGVAVTHYDLVASEFKRAKERKEWSEVGLILIPIHCKDARGNSNTDYTGREGPWSDYSKEGQCMYKIGDFRRLYPEYNNLSDNDLANQLYERAGRPLNAEPEPWHFVAWAVAIGIAFPLITLIFGWAVAWALSGFITRET
jgi:hypothetical protein